jgi:hypothetical protein
MLVNEQEKVIFLSMVQTGIYSMEYWSTNSNKWEELLIESGPNGWFGWGKVGAADAGGAGGMLTKTVLSYFFNGGVLTIETIVVVVVIAGLAASAGEAISQLWKHYF